MGMVEQVVQDMAIEEPGIPFGSRRIWAAYPGGLKLDPSGHSETGFRSISESSPLRCSGQSREPRADNGYEAPWPGHLLVEESFFICSVKGLGKTAGLGNLYVETVVDADCRLSFAKVCCTRRPLNADNFLQSRVHPFHERHGVRVKRVFIPHSRAFCGLIPAHPYEMLLASANIEHAYFGPGQGSLRLPCQQLYRILCQELFALEFRRTFQHSFGTLQRALDLFLEACNRERVIRDASKPGRTPLGLVLEGIRVAKHGDPGSESTLSMPSL